MRGATLPLVTVLVVIGVAAFFVRWAARERNAQKLAVVAEANRREKLLLEAQEAKRRDDERYNRIINCPGCEGTGVCGMEFDHTDGISLSWYVGQGRKPKSERQVGCPLCNRSGTALAFFSDETCPQCKGSGENIVRVKAEIGMEEEVVPCSACAGEGSTTVVNVRFAGTYFTGSFYFAEYFGPGISEGKEAYGGDCRRKFILSPHNKDLFNKWKPRDANSNA
jgi:hypothetical protein